MIANVSGRIQSTSMSQAVIEVNGIGLEVQIGPDTAAKLRVGESTQLQTSLIVREDSLTLYGFISAEQRAAFQLLQTASGIGPRLALAISSMIEPQRLRDAILRGEVTTLTAVPGVGQKLAQKMIIELKDKVTQSLGSATETLDVTASHNSLWRSQIVEGLVNLGYNVKDAEKACDVVAPQAEDPDVSITVLMKSALRALAR